MASINFDFHNPVNLITGKGCVKANSSRLAALGKKAMIVTGGSSARKSGALADMEEALDREGIAHILFDKVRPNPLLAAAKEAGERARAEGVDFIVAIGGGSPLDSAKATCVYAANDIPLMDIYNRDWKNPALPLVAVGTTAGTGSEVAPFSVMTTPENRKKSFASDQIFPTITFGDASYTRSLPLDFTVSTALDALCHAAEGYFSTMANEISDLYALEAVSILRAELEGLAAVTDIGRITPESRERLYMASVLAGFTLSRCGTCYCHTLGYRLTEEYGVAHGTACAVFLPGFLRRAERLVPGKTVRLTERMGCTLEELCLLAESLHGCPPVKLSREEIDGIVERGILTNNFLRTAPFGYTAGEAREELERLFGS